jgi:hypothetical protein
MSGVQSAVDAAVIAFNEAFSKRLEEVRARSGDETGRAA